MSIACVLFFLPKTAPETSVQLFSGILLQLKKNAPAQMPGKGCPMETIISACISAAVTLVVCMINNHGQQEKTRALMEYKLDELTKRVDKHNNLVERTYHLEEDMSVTKEQIKVANHRIEDLECRS